MRVLISGAAGFLGSWFLGYYLGQPDVEVIGVDLIPAFTPGRPGVVFSADFGEWLLDFDQDVDIAYHFASPVGGRIKIEGDPMYNADAFRLDSAFFRWAIKHAKLAVYPSSSAVYPAYLQQRGALPQTERTVRMDGYTWGVPDELYGMTKLAGEFLAAKAAEKYGLATLCIRPFSGYGPGQSTDYPISAIAARARRRDDPLEVWGGKQRRDFIHVTDIIGATLARIEAGVDGYQAMNICSGEPTSFEEVARIFGEINGYEPEISSVEGPIGVLDRFGDPTLMRRYYTPRLSLRQGLVTVA